MDIENSDINKLMDKYRDCEGYKITSKLNNIGFSHNIFIQNSDILEGTLKKYEDPDFFIRLQKEDYLEYFKVVNKDLHNFLASVKTLVDHTRAVVEDIYSEDSDFRKKYDIEIQEKFVKIQLVSFIQNLRNYTLHRKIPFVEAEMNFNVDKGFENRILLSKNELLEWSKWPSNAKAYLKSLPEKFSLFDVVNEYKKIVINFYNWFHQQQQEYHKIEFEEFNKLGDQIESISKYIKDVGNELLSRIKEEDNNKGLY